MQSRFGGAPDTIDNRKTGGTTGRSSNPQILGNEKPSFKPEINRKSQKMVQQKAPIFSSARYQKELEERNAKMETLKQKRQAELQQKELQE